VIREQIEALDSDLVMIGKHGKVGAGRPVAWKRYETGDAVRGLRRAGGGVG
jgi:hypothetical protein